MTLRTKTLTAALALAICAGVPALAQDAATPVPAPQGTGAQQPSEPAATSDQTPAEAPAAPVEAGSGETPAGESATAPTQSSEPTSTPSGAEQTPMEAPAAPSVTATEGETPAEPQAEDAAERPAAPAGEAAPADEPAEAPAAEEPAAAPAEGAAETAPAAEPAAEEPAAEAPAEDATDAEPAGAGEEAGDAVQVTEGDEAAVPAETTGTVVAEEGHDDIEGTVEGEGEEAPAASHGAAHIEDIAFSFEGPFGKYDQFQLQRGLQVYTEVCSACHGMKFVPIRTLHDDGGPGLPEDQVRAYAANLTPILDPETGEERPRLPTDHFPLVTGEGMGPDLSLMAKARAGFHGPQGTGINQLMRGIGGPEYIHAILTGYTGEEVEQAGSVFYENTAFAGGLIAMPPPLSDDLVTYEDGTPATVDQMARDLSAFLMWTAEPKLTDRKQVGLVSVLLLIVLTSLLYLTNKRIWAPHKGKKLHR